MILERLDVSLDDLERRSGWAIKPQGACKGDRCVPLPVAPRGGRIDVRVLADRLGMPIVHDAAHGLWAVGPESGGPVLASADAPDFVLPDRHGRPFALHSLRGQKIFLLVWASW